MSRSFDLFLFATDSDRVAEAAAAGVDGFVVDWECREKARRQLHADTEINHDTVEDLRRVRAATSHRVLCRLNAFDASTLDEVEAAVDAGADEILLPMVRTPVEVERLLDLVRDRVRVGILIETEAAVAAAARLATLPLHRVYVGLNDLAIDRGADSIFEAVLDRTVERLRPRFGCHFGFGGLTLPERGHPVPCRLLIAEMARLQCDFSLLRRSFRRDTRGRSLIQEIPRLRQALATARGRDVPAMAHDRQELEEVLGAVGLAL